MCDAIKKIKKNCWERYLNPGFYEIAFALELKSFDKAILFEYAEGMNSKTGPWDYALEDKGNIKKYQLLLPEIILKVEGISVSKTITFIPNEKELDSNTFRGIIGWDNDFDGDICFNLECADYRGALFYDVDIRKVDDFKDNRTVQDFHLAERFWLSKETLKAVKHNWNNSFWGPNIDKTLDCLKEFKAPEDMNEFRNIFSQCPPEIRCDLTFFGNYIVCLCLRFMLFKREDDKAQLIEWVDSITSLPHWGVGTANGADFDNDLTAAFNLFGLVVAENWLPEVLGKERRKNVKKKIYIQTKRIVEHAKTCRSSWPGTSTQNHAFFGYQTILLGGLALLDDYPEAIEWVNIATAAFKRFLKCLPEDGSYHEGIGYIPFALYGLMPSLLLLESVTLEKWVPLKWLQNHWKFCDELIPDDLKTGFYIDDGADSIPTCVPLALKGLFDSEVSDEAKGDIESIINKLFRHQKKRIVSSTNLLENLWGMLWNPQPKYCANFKEQPVSQNNYTYFDKSGFVIVNLNEDSKLYFLSGPPQGYTDYSDINRYGCGHHHPHTGNILFNYKGEWLLSDTGYSLCKKSKEHNVLTFNEIGQYSDGYVWATALPEEIDFPKVVIENIDGGVKLTLELASYYPPDAGVISWNRCIKCYYNKGFEIMDKVKCKGLSDLSLFWGSDLPWQKTTNPFEYTVKELKFHSTNKDVAITKEVTKKRSKEDWHAIHISPEEKTNNFTFISNFTFKDLIQND
jgi:hypothetical protein